MACQSRVCYRAAVDRRCLKTPPNRSRPADIVRSAAPCANFARVASNRRSRVATVRPVATPRSTQAIRRLPDSTLSKVASAVDTDDLAGHVISGLYQKTNHRGDFLWRPRPGQRDAVDQALSLLLRIIFRE